MGIYIKGMKMPKDDQKIRFVKLLNGKMYALKETRNGWPLSYLHEVIEVTEPQNYCDDCLYTDTCDSKEFFYACTSKATISKMEQVDKDTNVPNKEGADDEKPMQGM